MPAACLTLLGLALIFTSWLAPTSEAGKRSTYKIDQSFGDRGLVSDEMGLREISSRVSSQALVRDSRGRVIYATASGTRWRIRRYLPSGSPDLSFGSEGEVKISEWGGVGSLEISNVTSAAIRPDGRILLVGFGQSRRGGTYGSPSLVMSQLMSDGSPDPSFGQVGNGGVGYGSGSGAATVALQKDGRFLVGGYDSTRSRDFDQGLLLRFLPDGKIDESFADDGRLLIESSGIRHSYVLDLEVLPGGRILAGATKSSRYMLIRLRKDGSFDRSFGGGNGRTVVEVDRGKCRCEIARAMATDKKGRILLTGHATRPDIKEPIYVATARFTKKGRLDRSFGRKGVTRLRFRRSTRAVDIGVDPRGGILVAGRTGSRNGPTRALLVRYLPSGKLDRSFFNDGKLFRKNGRSSANWRVLTTNGRKVYLGGQWERGKKEYLSLQRLIRTG